MSEQTAVAEGPGGFGRFALARLIQALAVVLGVTTIVFVITRLIGDPVQVMLPLDASAADRDTLRHALGLDQSLARQYLSYLAEIARLDFGNSLWQQRPALEIVLERLPYTAVLCVAAIAVATLIGPPLGVLAAIRPGRLADRLAVVTSLLGLSLPQFWLGLLLMMLFAITLQWLPSSGGDGAAHLVLPALTLALPTIGRLAIMTRSAMIDELNAPYIRTALAKGLRFRRILTVHALRNVMAPTLSVVGWEFARMIAGYTVVVETVFAWPGVGLAAVQAIQKQDLVLLQAIVFFTALIVVAANLAIDLLLKRIDPRIEL
jgi:peptide/nickel transport system permease protein